MSFNQPRYDRGYQDAEYSWLMYDGNVEKMLDEYTSLEGSSAVNEFEVGWRTFLEERGVQIPKSVV